MPEKQYIVDPVTGDRYCVGGCIISSHPSDVPKFGVTRTLSNKHLPPSVDLRQLMTPVESQGELNSWYALSLNCLYRIIILFLLFSSCFSVGNAVAGKLFLFDVSLRMYTSSFRRL